MDEWCLDSDKVAAVIAGWNLGDLAVEHDAVQLGCGYHGVLEGMLKEHFDGRYGEIFDVEKQVAIQAERNAGRRFASVFVFKHVAYKVETIPGQFCTAVTLVRDDYGVRKTWLPSLLEMMEIGESE